MKIFKKSISFTALAILTFLNSQCMEVGESDQISLDLGTQQLYNCLLIQSNNDRTQALLKIMENPYILFFKKKYELAFVKKLIDDGADVNGVNINKTTPLIFAVKNKNIPLTDLLITNGALVNGNLITPSDGNTPLKEAILKGDLDMIKFLVKKKGADIEYVDPIKLQTALHQAVFSYRALGDNRAPIISYLLSQGANYNKIDINGMTPLSFAQEYRNQTLENLLLTGEYTPAIIEEENSNQTQFSIECNIEPVTSNSNNVTFRENELRNSRSHTRFLISKIPNIPFVRLDYNARTSVNRGTCICIEDLSGSNNNSRISTLISIGDAELNFRNSPFLPYQQRTNTSVQEHQQLEDNALLRFLRITSKQTIRTQPSKQCPQNITTERAAQQQIIQELSQINRLKSQSLDTKTLQLIAKQQDRKTGRTALIDAAQAKLTSFVQQLLKAGADPRIKDKTGKTALQYAFENKDQEMIKILIIPTSEALKNEYTTELDDIELFKNK